jgi:hypothetical protein
MSVAPERRASREWPGIPETAIVASWPSLATGGCSRTWNIDVDAARPALATEATASTTAVAVVAR